MGFVVQKVKVVENKLIDTRIYAVDVTELKDEALYRAAYQKATYERRQKTDGLHFFKDRCLSLGAELLLLYGVEQLGLAQNELSYQYGENGKPYLKGKRELCFNFSHSGEIALCAVSSMEIGCDIEKVSDISLNVAKRFFVDKEYEMIMSEKTEVARQEMFFRLWTLKESFMKANGLGLSLPMDSFCINFDRGGISVNQTQNHKRYYFQEYTISEEYKCSVCGLAPEIGSKHGVPLEMLSIYEILSGHTEESSGVYG